jgi:hypothetical protein
MSNSSLKGGRSPEVGEWSAKYNEYLNNPPVPGTILRAYGDGEMARIDVDIEQGKPPFLYGRAYVPCIVGSPLGWYLQARDNTSAYGWKCILLPKAREEAIRRLGLDQPVMVVYSLKVVRTSQSGNSLLCEIAEFNAPPAPAVQPPEQADLPI